MLSPKVFFKVINAEPFDKNSAVLPMNSAALPMDKDSAPSAVFINSVFVAFESNPKSFASMSVKPNVLAKRTLFFTPTLFASCATIIASLSIPSALPTLLISWFCFAFSLPKKAPPFFLLGLYSFASLFIMATVFFCFLLYFILLFLEINNKIT